MTPPPYFPDDDAGWHTPLEGFRWREHPLRAHTDIHQFICNSCRSHGNLEGVRQEFVGMSDAEFHERGLEYWDGKGSFDENGICGNCRGNGYFEYYHCTKCNSALRDAWHDCNGPRPAIQ
jgi:hypothetical protein